MMVPRIPAARGRRSSLNEAQPLTKGFLMLAAQDGLAFKLGTFDLALNPGGGLGQSLPDSRHPVFGCILRYQVCCVQSVGDLLAGGKV